MAVWALSGFSHVLVWFLGLWVSFPRPRHSLSGLGGKQWSQTPKSNVFCMVGLIHKKVLYPSLGPIYLETGVFLSSSCPPSWGPKPVLLPEVLGEAERR